MKRSVINITKKITDFKDEIRMSEEMLEIKLLSTKRFLFVKFVSFATPPTPVVLSVTGFVLTVIQKPTGEALELTINNEIGCELVMQKEIKGKTIMRKCNRFSGILMNLVED